MIDWEDAAERRVDDWRFDNVPHDSFICPDCGRKTNLAESVPSGPSPFSLPICLDCATGMKS